MFSLSLSTSLIKCLMKERTGKVMTRVNGGQNFTW